MDISDELLCLFSGRVEHRDGSYVIEVPEQELDAGAIDAGDPYRVAMLSHVSTDDDERDRSESRQQRDQSSPNRSQPNPPVEEGERRDVEIEDLGDQGDGLTRVERGYVVIVPDTEPGERVTVEITDVQQNVAFADVIDRQSHFE